jgi:predicted metallopeptidase
MAKELNRLKELDKMYNLQFADMAENLEEKYKRNQKENIQLLHEIDGIPRKHELKKIPIQKSGGLYLQFGNNKIQKDINKAHFEIIKQKL